MLKIKKKDKVMIKTGKDSGKIGEVLKVFIGTNRLIVSKANMVKRHQRPSQKNPGGILEKEASISISNVSLICPQCDKATRVGFKLLGDGKKMRVCKKCKEGNVHTLGETELPMMPRELFVPARITKIHT